MPALSIQIKDRANFEKFLLEICYGHKLQQWFSDMLFYYIFLSYKIYRSNSGLHSATLAKLKTAQILRTLSS